MVDHHLSAAAGQRRAAGRHVLSPLMSCVLSLLAAVFIAAVPMLVGNANQSSAGQNSAGQPADILLYSLPATHYYSALHVTGLGRPHQPIAIELNQRVLIRTQTNEMGDFAATIALKPGLNILRVLGDVGTTGLSRSDTYRIRYIPTPAQPLLPMGMAVINVGPAAPVLSVPPPVATGNPITISGTALPETLISFFVNGRFTRSIVTDASGAFSGWVPLEDGANSIYAVAEDAGGQSPTSNTVEVSYTNSVPRTQTGTLTQNAVWTAGDGTPYTISGNLVVPAGVTLWLQPGARLNVAGNFKLQVKGALVVQGTAAAPVVLRPAATA